MKHLTFFNQVSRSEPCPKWGVLKTVECQARSGKKYGGTEIYLPSLFLIFSTLAALTFMVVKILQHQMTQDWLTKNSNENSTPINLTNDADLFLIGQMMII